MFPNYMAIMVMYTCFVSESQLQVNAVMTQSCVWKGNYWSVSLNGAHGKCSPCSECPAGKYMRERCTRYNDTKCARCAHGTFSLSGFRKNCIPCSKPSCLEGFQFRKCRRNKDSECIPCKRNYFYLSEENRCQRCSKCPAGYFVSRFCEERNDTVCKPCPEGTFLSMPSLQRYCRACSHCRYGQKTIHPCSMDRNTVCGYCSSGYFRLESTSECAKCSECYRDYPGYTTEITECQHNSNGSDHVCMPVSYPPYTVPFDDDAEVATETKHYVVAVDYVSEALLIVTSVVVSVLFLVLMVMAVIMLCLKQRTQRMRKARKAMPMTLIDKVMHWRRKGIPDENCVLMIASSSEPLLTGISKKQQSRHSYPCIMSLLDQEDLLSSQLYDNSEGELSSLLLSVSAKDITYQSCDNIVGTVTSDAIEKNIPHPPVIKSADDESLTGKDIFNLVDHSMQSDRQDSSAHCFPHSPVHYLNLKSPALLFTDNGHSACGDLAHTSRSTGGHSSSTCSGQCMEHTFLDLDQKSSSELSEYLPLQNPSTESATDGEYVSNLVILNSSLGDNSCILTSDTNVLELGNDTIEEGRMVDFDKTTDEESENVSISSKSSRDKTSLPRIESDTCMGEQIRVIYSRQTLASREHVLTDSVVEEVLKVRKQEYKKQTDPRNLVESVGCSFIDAGSDSELSACRRHCLGV